MFSGLIFVISIAAAVCVYLVNAAGLVEKEFGRRWSGWTCYAPLPIPIGLFAAGALSFACCVSAPNSRDGSDAGSSTCPNDCVYAAPLDKLALGVVFLAIPLVAPVIPRVYRGLDKFRAWRTRRQFDRMVREWKRRAEEAGRTPPQDTDNSEDDP